MEVKSQNVVGTPQSEERRPVHLRGINRFMYLGWSEGFHDAGVCVIDNNGHIVFATHSERFSGRKHDKYVGFDLKGHINGMWRDDIVHKAFFEKPFLKKTRQLYATQWDKVFKKRFLTWEPDSVHPHHQSHFHRLVLILRHLHTFLRTPLVAQSNLHEFCRCQALDIPGVA